MRSHRFYTPINLQQNTSIELPAEAAHHCAQVLRYKVGDTLSVFNGDGFDYLATVIQIEKKRCQISLTSRLDPDNESPLKIHLLQGVARGDKMDLIIQKAVELGVSEITPLFTERCNVKLDGKRLDKKLQHWHNTTISACEQSGRALIPKLHQPISINKLTRHKITSIYLEPTAKSGFGDLAFEQSLRLFIGPEGGFSDKDLAHLELLGCAGIKIGPRILRTETAGLSAISILQNLQGDL
jgi:16S rRNA (uracil1498-N3)-methyltransferase